MGKVQRRARMSAGLIGVLALLLTALPAGADSVQQPIPDEIAAPCPTDGRLHYICGVSHAEDLVAIDGTSWIAASNLAGDGPGLYLIDRKTRKARPALDAASERSPAPEFACRPSLGKLRTHGLAIQRVGTAGLRLLAVNHQPTETIELFDIDREGAVPRLLWVGCIALPAPMIGNSVVAKRDGTLYLSDTSSAGSAAERTARLLRGEPTGRIVAWRAGSFKPIEGLDLHGPSGTALSPDERWLFATSFADRKIWRIDLTGRTRPRSITVGFHPDNLRSDGPNIVAAGMAGELAPFFACRAATDTTAYCSHDWGVAVIAPATLKVRERRMSATDFGDVTAALPVDGRYWLGSVGKPDRIAITTLP